MGTIQIGGVSSRQLAEEFGTPLYVYDENRIRHQASAALSNFTSGEFETEVAYASKAFSCMAIYKLLGGMGTGFDVVSGGELYCAMKAGVDMSKVYFHGNNKSVEEIEMALEAGTGYFVIDNIQESERLIAAAERLGKGTKALIRVNPGISAHTHEYIMTSTPDSKFGIHIEDRSVIEDIVRNIQASEYVEHAGFHSHIGSQIVEVESFEKAIETMVEFLRSIKDDMGLDNLELSIGGGFGIKYVESDKPVSLGDMCKAMVRKAEEATHRMGVRISKLITEPGRAMVGEAGHTLYTIGDMKVSGDKHYIFVDGGMSDNIRPALYGAEYTADMPDKITNAATAHYCIAGKNCESGDVLIEDIALPEAERGDLLVVHSTGAYGYSMASNYNRLGRPAVVFVADGRARLIIKRESYSDQLKLEIGGEDN
jgi:diaminopimelate decarboxylase